MKRLLVALLFLVSIAASSAQTLSKEEAGRIADAIYLAEGGSKAKVPYGILSLKVRDKEHARRICLNTIQNNYRRWLNNGRKERFLDFLADRYCPPGDSVGNRNWKRNVGCILSKASS
jgi:hypothetical protein